MCIFITVEKKDEYSQEIPEYHQWEKVRGPPVLPPHLLQVILNKDTPISVSVIDRREILMLCFHVSIKVIF